ncbi:MAG: hypothetical protein KDK59_10895, partial [Simkania sp.]|nr:hypothetical protein [Simkania sp.]
SSFINGLRSGALSITTSLLGEASANLIGKKVDVGGFVHKWTPTCVSNIFRDTGNVLRPNLGWVIQKVESITGEDFANVVFAPAFEELVYRVGGETLVTAILTTGLSSMGVPPPYAATLAKLGSIHITGYLFTMSHGPVQTDRGSRQYTRAVSRGIAYELSPTVGSGYLNTAIPHILYNAAIALRSKGYI